MFTGSPIYVRFKQFSQRGAGGLSWLIIAPGVALILLAVAKLLAADTPHAELVEQLYLAALCRPPTEAERNVATSFLEASPSAQECYEDLLWALLNSKQFLFVY